VHDHLEDVVVIDNRMLEIAVGLGERLDPLHQHAGDLAGVEAGGAKILQAPEQRDGEPILLGVFRDAEGNEVFMTQYVG
jgi:hypothetical protein